MLVLNSIYAHIWLCTNISIWIFVYERINHAYTSNKTSMLYISAWGENNASFHSFFVPYSCQTNRIDTFSPRNKSWMCGWKKSIICWMEFWTPQPLVTWSGILPLDECYSCKSKELPINGQGLYQWS